MEDLLRHLAPVTSAAWALIDEQARQVLKVNLAARHLVDFEGPKGWRKSSINLGRISPLPTSPVKSVTASLRDVQPLVELRAPFELSRTELDNVGRGCPDPDLDALIQAAIAVGHAEDKAVFHGFGAARIGGIIERSPHPPLPIKDDYEAYPGTVANATRILRMAGVDGPYAIALGPRCYTGLLQAMGRGGFPVLEVVRQVVGGPVVWAPAIDGAVVMSTRGGDFELTVGQDFSIGYTSHTATTVSLYLVESITFRVLTPEAGVWLRYGS